MNSRTRLLLLTTAVLVVSASATVVAAFEVSSAHASLASAQVSYSTATDTLNTYQSQLGQVQQTVDFIRTKLELNSDSENADKDRSDLATEQHSLDQIRATIENARANQDLGSQEAETASANKQRWETAFAISSSVAIASLFASVVLFILGRRKTDGKTSALRPGGANANG